MDSDSEKQYEVDFIEAHKVSKDKERIEFKVRWKGYGQKASTWEPFDYFAYDAPDIVQKYVIGLLAKGKGESEKRTIGEKQGGKKSGSLVKEGKVY